MVPPWLTFDVNLDFFFSANPYSEKNSHAQPNYDLEGIEIKLLRQ